MDKREMFEQWYIENAFDYVANPLGSRECGLQWQAWQAARRTTPDREAIIEECAKVCEELSAGFSEPGKRRTRMTAAAMQGALTCAYAIRALKTAPTTSPRDTLIEEIAEMVDHMGEGRRLEEYVEAIREMKTAPTSDKGGA